jgi:hypothetical protein
MGAELIEVALALVLLLSTLLSPVPLSGGHYWSLALEAVAA